MSSHLPPSRRTWLRNVAVGGLGLSLSGWFDALARAAGDNPQRKRSCILLWMTGGPSTIDLWDLKPDHESGGLFRPIATSVPGLQIGEHLPLTARRMERVAVVRSMSTKEGDHGRASFLMRTGYAPQGAVQYPTIGAVAAKEMGDPTADLPPHVRVAPPNRNDARILGDGAGFLGPQFAPLVVGDAGGVEESADDALGVPNLCPVARSGDRATTDADEFAARVGLLEQMDRDFAATRPNAATDAHRAAYEHALRLMRPEAARVFDLSGEAVKLRDAYGRTPFGQGCLLARRLVEAGVPFVEVGLEGWDTHNQNFERVARLAPVLDAGWSALMDDLGGRGLLDSTLIVWMGEFGRTPAVNAGAGRDHFPHAWSVVLAGGGIKGGQAVGRTSKDGMTVEERPTSAPDLIATLCRALGVNPRKQNPSNGGRPVRIADASARPIEEVLA
ncbi:MAG TPA: DUF1501 domain-containing protein [Gemmataceae bacterium]|nr:DUF1501 domain-containing protein [Gemmataceae bacterium]